MKKHLSSPPITTSTMLKASYIPSQKTLLLVHVNIGWNQSPTVPNHGDKVSDFKKKQQNPVCVYMTKTIGTTVLIYIDMMIFYCSDENVFPTLSRKNNAALTSMLWCQYPNLCSEIKVLLLIHMNLAHL